MFYALASRRVCAVDGRTERVSFMCAVWSPAEMLLLTGAPLSFVGLLGAAKTDTDRKHCHQNPLQIDFCLLISAPLRLCREVGLCGRNTVRGPLASNAAQGQLHENL